MDNTSGTPGIIDNETLDMIIMLLKANPLIKLREIKEKVQEIWPTKINFSENLSEVWKIERCEKL